MTDPLFAWARQEPVRADRRLIREFVECESPSDSPAAVKRFMDLLADSVPA